MKSNIPILSVIFFALCLQLSAQDIHFSHIHASPLNLNPALTGVFEGQVRLIGNYRNQWQSVTANYRTSMFSGDVNLPGFNNNGILGIGAQFYSDIAGDLDYRTTSGSMSLSVMQAFDAQKSHILAGGLQVGRVRTSFDPTRIVAYDQEPGLGAGETNQSGYFDLAAGLLWYKKLNHKKFLYMGGAMYHINSPTISYFEDEEGSELYRRYVLHGGANLNIGKNYTLIPNFIFMQQGPHQQLTFGSFVRYDSPARLPKGQASLMFGGWIRGFALEDRLGTDAIVTAVRVDYAGLIFTFTYDINVSSLSQVSVGRGGPEFSLVYLIGTQMGGNAKLEAEKVKNKKSGIKCPVF